MVNLAFIMLSFMYLFVGEWVSISDLFILLHLVDPIRMIDRNLLGGPFSR